ncbi:MAG: hypothetical protein DRP45_04955 [Candidatus Zixiibacteriota bacterium]|nr:MAG: hypothetical protein DRP45_04955 [candidate division Zixibacteria bacterium]
MREQNDRSTAFCESLATYLKSLVTRRDFAKVIECYEANRTMVTEADDTWAGHVLHQVAKSHASLTNYPAALRAARMAQTKAVSESDRVLLADIFVTLGNILRDTGELSEAEKAFRDAESIFRRNDSPEGQSRALNQLAGLYFRQTNYANALAVLMDAVSIARRLGDNQKLAYMMGNIGRLQTFLGDFVDAEKHLRINVDLSTELGDKIEIARARLSLGYIYLQKADYDNAEQQFNQACSLISVLNAPREEIMYLTYLGELQYRTSQFGDARKTLERAMALAEESVSGTSLAGCAMRHLAELHVRTGSLRTAERLAARSSAIMKKTGDKVEIGALTKIKAQVAALRKQAARSCKLFLKAIDLLDESGVRWEKAEALVAAGSSEVFDDRQRMTYLFRAEEFYTRARLDRKLKDIGRRIAELGAFNSDGHSDTAERRNGAVANYITCCEKIRTFKSQLPILGKSDLPVLLTGETGVGKDHLARHFHSLVRPNAPYVAINCASVPETLLESELFGFCRGAFTGADSDKKGLFVTANGGVLLLDEIGDMPLSLQAKLLGVLEMRKVIPLGGVDEVDIDVMLVAATNRNLEEMVEQGTFRRDLYYRLSGVTFQLPPLRERKEDIPLLLEYFVNKYDLAPDGKDIPAEVVRQFIDYDWPGNIRELDNKVRRFDLMAQMASEGDLVDLTRSLFSSDQAVASSNTLFERVEEFERQLIIEALLASRGNKSEAARMLGVHEATVRTKLKRYGIALPGTETSESAPT